MRIEDVVDRETLEAYLQTLSNDERREIGLQVAFNAAARVLPLAVINYLRVETRRDGSIPAAAFGSTALVRASKHTTLDGVGGIAASVAWNDVSASIAAACAAKASEQSEPNKLVGFVVRSIVNAIDAVTYADQTKAAIAWSIDPWDPVRANLRGEDQVWPGTMPDFAVKTWQDAKTVIADDVDDWTIWVQWYDRVLSNRPWHPKAMGETLKQISREDWLKGSEYVNPMFDEVLNLYQEDDVDQVIAATPVAADVVFDDQQHTLVLRPTDLVDYDFLREVLDQLYEALRLIDPDELTSNALSVLEDEARIIGRAIELHSNRPVQLLKSAQRVLKRLDRKVAVGDCPSPDQDADIEDIKSILTSVQIDLIALSPEVRRYHEATKPEVEEDAVPFLVEGARQLAEVSDPELAQIFEEESGILEEPSQDAVGRRGAFYLLAGLIVRGYRAVRNATKEAAGFAKDASIVVGGASAAGTGVIWLLSPQFRETVTILLRSFGG